MRSDLPIPEHDTEAFWSAARERELLIRRCLACDHVFFYPRPFCPECWSTDVEWRRASGRGIVYTYSVVRRNDLPPFRDRVPYVAAIVELDEGPRVSTNIVDCDPDDVSIGMLVEVTFREESEVIALPVFKPR